MRFGTLPENGGVFGYRNGKLDRKRIHESVEVACVESERDKDMKTWRTERRLINRALNTCTRI